MKKQFSFSLIAVIFACFVVNLSYAQTQEQAPANPPKVETLENKSDTPPDADAPLDGIIERKTIFEKQLLAWEPVRECDVMWRKTIWRVIDIREKMNLPFSYPEANFFTVLMKGLLNEKNGLKAYKPENDKFWYKMTPQELASIGARVDTVEIVNPITYEREYKAVKTNLNAEDIKRYRIKEEWYFDKQYSVMKVRIIGIAPLIEESDQAGNFLGERPLFWVRYPDCREYLAQQKVFSENEASPMSWDDLFEMRHFSSYITKESNVHGRRLQDYLSGVDLLMEGEKIKQEIFNFEHDLWSY